MTSEPAARSIVAADEMMAVIARALEQHGATAEIARSVARATADSEARGNRICGLGYVESYCLALASGRVDGRAVPVATRPRPGVVRVDGAMGFAQPAFEAGLPLAVQAARDCGIASLAVGHTHTATALGYFTRAIAAEGLIGIGFTNASPVVAPPGGRKPVIGTNPVAFTVPGPAGVPRLDFDSATSAVALGTVAEAKYRGAAIPTGWAIDSEGRPTTDPAEALKGALQSLGGAKGWGFGLMVEVMAAGLTGSVNSLDVKGLKLPDGPPHDLGQTYILIDPAAFDPAFDARLARLEGAMTAEPGVRLPGQGRRAADKVEVDTALWALIQRLAGSGTPPAP